jgi:hypothetical protein
MINTSNHFFSKKDKSEMLQTIYANEIAIDFIIIINNHNIPNKQSAQ